MSVATQIERASYAALAEQLRAARTALNNIEYASRAYNSKQALDEAIRIEVRDFGIRCANEDEALQRVCKTQVCGNQHYR